MLTYQSHKGRDWSQVRIILLWVLFGLIWLALWAKAYQVQMISGRDLASRADQQYWSKESTFGQRGEIVDRKGRLLAKSLTVNSVFARPQEVQDAQSSAQKLAHILDLQESTLLEMLHSERSFVWISRHIGDLQAFKVNSSTLPGIYLTEERRRFYPQGGLAGQLLGFVGLDNHGLEGLELAFDSYLTGEKQEYVLQRDAAGNLLYAPGQFEQDLSGRQLQLTLDSRLQHAVERALAGAVQKHRARAGMSLVLEVQSGEILAWANYPFFNPNNYRSSSPPERRDRLALDDFEPGSTLKPLMVAAALQEQICAPDTLFYCEQGQWRRKGFVFHDVREHGWLPVKEILRYSSNIGAGKLGLELEAENYHQYLYKLGLGQKTGLPLPSESPGILRPAGMWSEVDLIAASFGQGLSTTGLQLAQAFQTLANKGELTPLRIVQDPYQESRPAKQRVFSRRVAEQVLSMLREVVQGDGTGVQARIEGISMGGKTGTSQKAISSGGYGEEHLASFVGLLPALEPKYLILTVIDEPQGQSYGGLVAAPAVREMALEVLSHCEYLQSSRASMEPQNVELKAQDSSNKRFRAVTWGSDDAGRAARAEGMIPDLREKTLRRALEILTQKGIMPEIKGQGIKVQKQSPSPEKAVLESDQSWVLWLEEGQP